MAATYRHGRLMMNLKLIIASPLGYTGLAYYDFSLCESLAERGVDVELCTSDRWILGSYKNRFALSTIYTRCSGDIGKAVKGWNYIRSSFRLFLHALGARVPIVHFQIVELPVVDLMLMCALRLAGKKVVFTPHDMVHNKDYPLNRKITSLLYAVSDRIIVHKEANRETMARELGVSPRKIRIIPHGGYEYFIDKNMTKADARSALGIDAESKVILFFGNIRPEKGIEVFIDALPLIKDKVKNLRAIIAGRLSAGITAGWLRDRLDEKGVSDITLLRLGFISDEDTQPYYTASDIVVLPYTGVSESGVLRYAQTCGRSVVCSDLKEFMDTVVHGETGYFFRNRDHIDLAHKVADALSNPELDKIGRNSQKLMDDRYRWKEIAVSTEKVYNELLRSPGD